MATKPTKSTKNAGETSLAPRDAWNPFLAMRRLSGDMEQMFGDLWGARRGVPLWRGLGRGLDGQRWAPDVEVFERKGRLVVRADLPGLERDDIKVEVTDGLLTLQGERKDEQEREEKGYYTCERSYGSFFRSIPLPEGAKGDQATASFKDGVLEVSMPAPAAAAQKRGRRLEIKAS